MVGRRGKRRGKRDTRVKVKPFVLLSAIVILVVVVFSRDTLFSANIPHLDEILYHSMEAGEDPALILAMIQTESRFRANAVSPKGAVGLMQVMPDTARWMAGRLDMGDFEDEKLYERAYNLQIGIAYMRYLRGQFPDSLPKAIASYNAGPARVRSWLDEGDWDGTVEGVEGIPYRETRNYVTKVLRLYGDYSRRLSSDVYISQE